MQLLQQAPVQALQVEMEASKTRAVLCVWTRTCCMAWRRTVDTDSVLVVCCSIGDTTNGHVQQDARCAGDRSALYQDIINAVHLVPQPRIKQRVWGQTNCRIFGRIFGRRGRGGGGGGGVGCGGVWWSITNTCGS